MEATSTSGAEPLTRKGAATPPQSGRGGADHPIDGVASCSCCHRFPLVGEQVTRHLGRKGHVWACESCERSGRSARLGAVTGSDRVRSLGGATNVHRAA